MNIEEKLFYVRYNIDHENPHIVIDKGKCKGCIENPCLLICPVGAYKKEGDEIFVSWQDCMECGTCRVSCPQGAIQWEFPRGGYGVCFRYG
jgi:ferredoxin like protein